jgi:hypothetical protein
MSLYHAQSNFAIGTSQKHSVRQPANKENIGRTNINYSNKENVSINNNNKENISHSVNMTQKKEIAQQKPIQINKENVVQQSSHKTSIRKQLEGPISKDMTPKNIGSTKKESKCGSGFDENYFFDNKENVSPNFLNNADNGVFSSPYVSHNMNVPFSDKKTPSVHKSTQQQQQPFSAYKPQQPSSAYKTQQNSTTKKIHPFGTSSSSKTNKQSSSNPNPSSAYKAPYTPIIDARYKSEKEEKEIKKKELREMFDELFQSDDDVYDDEI